MDIIDNKYFIGLTEILGKKGERIEDNLLKRKIT